MSNDKRTVTTDALETLGSIISEKEARDAIHLAVEPVIAGQILSPGADVGIRANGKAYNTKVKHVGIVDPFLNEPVMKGERFWLVVYPRQITSLRHVWTHPAFDDIPASLEIPKVAPKSSIANTASIKWLEEFADSVDLTYSALMSGADYWVATSKAGGYGGYLVGGANLEGETVPDDFWDHYDIVKDTHTEERHRGSFFTCRC